VAKYKINGEAPTVHPSAYVAEMACVIGKVKLDENTSVWDFAAIRGDNELIHIMEGSNVQEGAVLHTDIGYPMIVGKNVTVGHQGLFAWLHCGRGQPDWYSFCGAKRRKDWKKLYHRRRRLDHRGQGNSRSLTGGGLARQSDSNLERR
jgi:hypothetical protein